MSKILLVEDDNNLREIYEARLQAEGYTIVTAHDGEEALVVAKAEKPDLIISDIMMPKISGFEMLDILRNTDGLKDVKIIMLTALGQSDDQQRADRLGADRYLVKSQVTLEDIVKVAHDLLDDSQEPVPSVVQANAEPTPPPAAAPAPEPAAEPAPAAAEPAAAPAPEPVAAAPTAAEPPAAVSDAPTAPAPEPPTPVDEPVTPVPDQPQTDDAAQAAADDKLMAEAVQTLVNSTGSDEDTAEDTAPAATEETEAASPSEPPQEQPAIEKNASSMIQPDAAQTPAEADPADDPEAKAAGAVTVAGKKVIKPLEQEAKPDLDELLAREAAKEADGQAATPTPIVVTDSPEEATSTAPKPTVISPVEGAADPPITDQPSMADITKVEAVGTDAPAPEPADTENTGGGDAQSTAQEEAAVEAKIEDFVAGASEEATPPPAPDASQGQEETDAAQAAVEASEATEEETGDSKPADAPKTANPSAAPAPEQPPASAAPAPGTTVDPNSIAL